MPVPQQRDAIKRELLRDTAYQALCGAIVDGTFDAWTTTTRGLLRRAVKAGAMRPELDSAPVAALIVATLNSLTLPPMADTRGDDALRQLERWLGIGGVRKSASSK